MRMSGFNRMFETCSGIFWTSKRQKEKQIIDIPLFFSNHFFYFKVPLTDHDFVLSSLVHRFSRREHEKREGHSMCREDGFSDAWREKLRLDFELQRGGSRFVEGWQGKNTGAEGVIKMGTKMRFRGNFYLDPQSPPVFFRGCWVISNSETYVKIWIHPIETTVY